MIQTTKLGIDEIKALRDGAKKPAPKKPVKKEPSEEPQKWAAHNIPTPLHLLLAHRPKQKPYAWQAQTLFQLAGYDATKPGDIVNRPTDKLPLYFNLVAANGSGKDQVVIAAFAAWFALAKVRSRCIITSSSHEQLKDQTFKYIKALCEDINHFHGRKIFEVVEFLITCLDTGSEIKCFVTDDPGKAEGRHPFDDYPGAEMAVIVNEAKSISDELFQAFSRFTGYNYWLEISSPGTIKGHFYKRCTLAEATWPQPLQLGKFYYRRITAFDCDHLLGAHIENLKKEYGENSLIYRSQVLAEFTSIDEAAYISSTFFENYPATVSRQFGLPTRAGIDISLGGDETVMYVLRAGKLHMRICKVRREAILHHQLISWFKEFNLDAQNIFIDDGGVGKAILQRLEDAGWAINKVRNEQRATQPQFFKNRGVQNWARIKRLLEERLLPTIKDDLTRIQLTTRAFSVNGLVTSLEKKSEMRARGLTSPDRADALALCFDGLPFDTFINAETPTITRYSALVEKATKGKMSPDDIVELENLMRDRSATAAQNQQHKGSVMHFNKFYV